MVILGLSFGFLIGALLMNFAVEEEKNINKTLKKTINNLEDELNEKELEIKSKDKLIEDYQKENIILINNAVELRNKVTDLENNIEFLVKQLPKQKRELVRPGNQN